MENENNNVVPTTQPVQQPEVQAVQTPVEQPVQQPEVQSTAPKKKNPIWLILIIVLMIGCLIGGYFLNESGVFGKETNTQENGKGNEKEKEKEKDNTDDTTETDEVKELDLSKGIDTDGNYSNPVEAKTVIGVSVKGENTKEPKLVINWEEFGPHSTASAWAPETKEYEIKGFTKNVKYGVVGEVGQSAVSTTVFYLMEDGTVEYTKLFNKKTDTAGNTYYEMNYTYEKDSDGKITGQHFETQGAISGVKDVVKFYNVDVHVTGGSGARTTIGATKDGSFYDVGSMLNK